jgi:hypothetical protein
LSAISVGWVVDPVDTLSINAGPVEIDNGLVRMRIDDPDAPNATSYEQLVLDGDEDYRIDIVTPAGAAAYFFQAPGQYPPNHASFEFLDGVTPPRNMVAPGDSDGQFPIGGRSHQPLLYRFRLQEGPYDATNPDRGDHTEAVEFIDMWNWLDAQFIDRGSMFIVGRRRGAMDLPLAGAEHFDGEAVLRLGTPDQTGFAVSPYVFAVVSLDVDYAARSVSGVISANRFQGYLWPNLPAPFTVNFTAPIDASGVFSTTFALTTGRAGGEYSGTLTGAFYGLTGPDEIGAAFSLQRAGEGAIIGGLVAGQ